MTDFILDGRIELGRHLVVQSFHKIPSNNSLFDKCNIWDLSLCL